MTSCGAKWAILGRVGLASADLGVTKDTWGR
jgi:hypothetical protein